MLKRIFLCLALVLLVLLVVISLRPAEFRVTRSITISAPPEVVFAEVNDFHRWTAWSPWEGIDPALARVYSGPAAGAGAAYSWSGNARAGEGAMTLSESNPPKQISIVLTLLRPFPCTNAVGFTFTPTADGTQVVWTMSGTNNFMAKAAGLFLNMDKLVGSEFAAGLAKLKTVAEAAAHK